MHPGGEPSRPLNVSSQVPVPQVTLQAREPLPRDFRAPLYQLLPLDPELPRDPRASAGPQSG